MRMPELKGYSPFQFAMFRIALGTYLAIHFAMLIPYGAELFSREGVLPDPSLNLTYSVFPNVLNLGPVSSPLGVSIVLSLLSLLSIFYTAGFYRRPIALILWYGWAALFNRNNLIANPGLPYIGWLLLASALIPDGEGMGVSKFKKEWRLPPELFFGAWILLAFGYTLSGIAKLKSPSWVDGMAFVHLLHNPLARDTALRDWMIRAPVFSLKLNTWISLFFEVAFLPLSFWLASRFLIWSSLLVMHLAILCFISFADLTGGMLLVHFFTFDPRWFPPKPEKESPIIFFDGVCGLCNHFIDFIFQEDHCALFRVAPLQGETAKKLGIQLSESETGGSIVLKDEAGLHYGSTAVLRIFAKLGGIWRVMSWAQIIPLLAREVVYRFIAKNRYRFFGKKETCRLPTESERGRFIS